MPSETLATARRRRISAAKQVSERAALAEKKSAELSRLTRTVGFLAIALFVALVTAAYNYGEFSLSTSLTHAMISHKINYRKDPFSQGLMYYNGYMPEGKNISLAIDHFRRAADAGDRNAGTALGMLYLKGVNVSQNIKFAMRWFEQAASLGETRAMSVLCFLHYKGHVDQTQDFLAAVKWCRKAADEGDAHAQFNLGVMVAHGQGEEQDYKEAYKWVSLAIPEMGEKAIDARNALVVRMSAEEVETASEMVQHWKHAHHERKYQGVSSRLWSMLGANSRSTSPQ